MQSLCSGRVDFIGRCSGMEIESSDLLMMGTRMVFAVVVCEIVFSGCPVDVKLFLLDATANSVEAHVDGLQALLFDVIIGNATGCRIVSLYRCWPLWVVHLL
jgi:hypothetical protein